MTAPGESDFLSRFARARELLTAGERSSADEYLERAFIGPLLGEEPFDRQDLLASLHAIAHNIAPTRHDLIDQIDTAYHEAGHAVVGRSFGMHVHEITILADGRTSGLCVCSPRPPFFAASATDRRDIQNEIVFEMAGPAAARMKLWSLGHPSNTEVWISHEKRAMELAARAIGADSDELRPYVSWLDVRAQIMVRRSWGKIVALAESLLEFKTLGEAAIEGMFAALDAEEAAAAPSMPEPVPAEVAA